MYKDLKTLLREANDIITKDCDQRNSCDGCKWYDICTIVENKINEMREKSDYNAFTIICNRCGSHNISIREDIDYDWDENPITTGNYYLHCNDCGNSEDYY